MKDFIEKGKKFLATPNITTPKFCIYTESGKVANSDTHKDGETLYAIIKMDDGKIVAFWGNAFYTLHGEKVYILSEHDEYISCSGQIRLHVTIPQEGMVFKTYSAQIVNYQDKFVL